MGSMGTPPGPMTLPLTVRRSAGGWRVVGVRQEATEPTEDLLSALVLADLLHAELAPHTTPGARPPRPDGELEENAALRLAVQQLEHALAARVAIEQAIGILAERTGEAPRLAFESLRQVARSRGQRVHELARKVVSSVTDSSIILPTGLPQSRRGTIPRPNESPQHDEPDATLV